MFNELHKLMEFITLAPWFIFGGFGGTFLMTFTIIKLAQSDTIYEWFSLKMTEWRAKRVAKIRRAIMQDANDFRAGRRVQEMSDVEQRIYFSILESGYERIAQLYVNGGGNGRAN